MDRLKEISRVLSLFVGPSQVTELRSLGVPQRPKAAHFKGASLDLAAKWVLQQESTGVKGVYFIPNPLNPAKFSLEQTDVCACDLDIAERRWFGVDIDPVRPTNAPATEEEKAEAWRVLEQCRVVCEGPEGGFSDPVQCDSGNGFYLFYPVRWPNDEASTERAKRLLESLHERCTDGRATVDTSMFNASRIWRIPCTLNTKGVEVPGRPHRYGQAFGLEED